MWAKSDEIIGVVNLPKIQPQKPAKLWEIWPPLRNGGGQSFVKR
jgi:hypothetical protein